MKQVFHEIEINTNGQKLYDFTSEVKKWIKKNEFFNGIINCNGNCYTLAQ